jgi:guanylate kinase
VTDEARPAPLLVVLSGPSGAGKDAVLDELERTGHRFHRVVTCTTRPRRDNETDGIDYHFISDADFNALVAGDGLLEHATVYGHQYGVPKRQVIDKLREGSDVMVRTDVQGAASIRRLAPGAVLIFIAPSSMDELEQRIRARGSDDEASISRRLETARGEMARREEFDHVVVNEPDRLEVAAGKVAGILQQERRKGRDYAALVEEPRAAGE